MQANDKTSIAYSDERPVDIRVYPSTHIRICMLCG